MPTKLVLPLLFVLQDECGATVQEPIQVDPPVEYGLERSVESVETEHHEYVYASGLLLREVITTADAEGNATTEVLDFTYDASGSPYTLTYTNGAASPVTYYYVVNLQGDVMRLVSGPAATVAEYWYGPYGEVLTASGTMAEVNPLRYRGYYCDAESEFYYLQFRYYDPAVCRFINADAFASTGHGFIGYNMFAYCYNNPVCYSDDCGSYPREALKYEIIVDDEGVKAIVTGEYTMYLGYGNITVSVNVEILLLEVPQNPNFFICIEEDTLIINLGEYSLTFKINESKERLDQPTWLCENAEIPLGSIRAIDFGFDFLTRDFTASYDVEAEGIDGSISVKIDGNAVVHWVSKLTRWMDNLPAPSVPVGGGGGNFQGNNGGIGGGGPGGCWGIPDFCSYVF